MIALIAVPLLIAIGLFVAAHLNNPPDLPEGGTP